MVTICYLMAKIVGDISIISIFGVTFGQMLVFDSGVPICRAAPNCCAIDIEDIASKLNLNVFLWIFCVI